MICYATEREKEAEENFSNAIRHLQWLETGHSWKLGCGGDNDGPGRPVTENAHLPKADIPTDSLTQLEEREGAGQSFGSSASFLLPDFRKALQATISSEEGLEDGKGRAVQIRKFMEVARKQLQASDVAVLRENPETMLLSALFGRAVSRFQQGKQSQGLSDLRAASVLIQPIQP